VKNPKRIESIFIKQCMPARNHREKWELTWDTRNRRCPENESP
jgi:hypothetical protein